MNKMKIEFISKSKNESFARSVASAFVLELDPTVQELSEIKTAVSEAVTNAIIHGYKNELGNVTIEGFIDNREVIFIISDKGVGIDNVDKAMEPMYTGSDDGERSGLGFTIMETFMDELEVKSVPGCGTTVRMRKKIGR
ncbi:MAG: anti-sigma F factor [Monoglobales bacterium]